MESHHGNCMTNSVVAHILLLFVFPLDDKVNVRLTPTECEDAIGDLNLEGFNEILRIVHGAPPNIPVGYANAC